MSAKTVYVTLESGGEDTLVLQYDNAMLNALIGDLILGRDKMTEEEAQRTDWIHMLSLHVRITKIAEDPVP